MVFDLSGLKVKKYIYFICHVKWWEPISWKAEQLIYSCQECFFSVGLKNIEYEKIVVLVLSAQLKEAESGGDPTGVIESGIYQVFVRM